ncbi:MAG: DNA mismatch repair protein MutS [Myxococcales bacterium]|nr:DNA mismatch repair protein MutS [Myxococcales bacterium]
MRQFLDVKDRHPDAIVFFRLGDFYEMFFEDAVVAAGLLDLTLTTRDKGKVDAVPMCGVPHHAARGYVAKLTDLGHKVVICEQVEDPKLAKGLVRRDVVRIVTPGVVVDEDALDPKAGRYVAAVVRAAPPAAPPAPVARGARKPAPEPAPEPRFGLAYLDVTTGEFRATELATATATVDELARVGPREVIVAADELAPGGMAAPGAPLRRYAAVWGAAPVPALADATAALGAALAEALAELAAQPALVQAAATVLAYARATQPGGTLPIARLACYQPGATMVLDEAAIANLELCQTLVGARRQGSLLDVLDDTTTAPGARLLRRWLLYPLTDRAAIAQRADAVADFLAAAEVRRELRRELKATSDLERLAGKATLGVAGPRDLGRLRDTLLALPALAALAVPSPRLDGAPTLTDLRPVATPALAALAAHLDAALVEQPGALVKDGGFVRPGFDAVVDECRGLADGGKDAIAAIEARERERTGISSLKVRYNRVFGYYIEITKSQLARVPDDYLRKQTVAGGERYVTRELAELEAKVLAAQDTLATREAEVHRALIAEVAALYQPLLAAGAAIATIDVCLTLAEVAERRGWARPIVDDSVIIDIKDGRHPVIEALVPAGTFVPNDARLDADREQVVLVTGPNMAGKSTFMRQVAHIVILAQVGSFVPAAAATIGVCDRVFTRVGATDNLARGDSTFMVEMRETAAILAHATRRSLVVLDEVGRGTSTFDGVSIAWAVAEYLHDAIGARTLFATHYHELTAMADDRPRVHNVSALVREQDGEVAFLRRIVPGAASKSYGIDVARLAGLPRSVIARARAILARLEGDGAALPSGRRLAAAPPGQLSLLPALAAAVDAPAAEVAQRLRALDPDRMTPIAALAALAELRGLLGPGNGEGAR